MPGKLGRPADALAIAMMVVGASVGVFLAVDQTFLLRFIIIALGAAIGLGVGRLIGTALGGKTKRPPR
jgi:hypothetical protein